LFGNHLQDDPTKDYPMTNKNIILTLKLSPNTKPTISNADLTKFVNQVKGLLRKGDLVVEVRKN
jgi:hypothetical protein